MAKKSQKRQSIQVKTSVKAGAGVAGVTNADILG